MDAGRRFRIGLAVLVAVIVLAGTAAASGVAPAAAPTFVATPLATGSLTQTRPEADANYVVYQMFNSAVPGSHSDVVLRDIDSGVSTTIGGGDAFDQTNPDVSQGRVVYEDDSAGNSNVRLYDEWLALDVALTSSADEEVMPRVSGNLAAWYNSDTDRIQYRDFARGVTGTVPDSSDVVYLDVDRGRIFWTDALITQNCYVFEPGIDTTSQRIWEQLNSEDILSLRAYGDHAAMTLDTVTGTKVYRASTTGSFDLSLADDTSEPAIFDDAVVYQTGAGQQNLHWYDWPKEGVTLSANVATTATDETHPTIFGNRIFYQYEQTILNQDIYMATAPTEVARSQGADRYMTAVEASKAYFHAADSAVLCTGLNFPDALSAGPFARLVNGPLLLTKPNAVSAETMDELDRLGVTKVYLIGGADVVNESVKTQLQAEGITTSRIQGSDRYATSIEIAKVMADQVSGAYEVDMAFFARGDNFPDALAVGPVAAGAISPIILVKPNEVPTVVSGAVDTLNIRSGVTVGGSDVVSNGVFDGLVSIMQDNGGDEHPMERWFGADRYATAIDVVENGVAARWIDLDTVGVATGLNFPDALGGGAALGHYGSPVLLVRDPMPASVTGWIDENGLAIGRLEIFGGPDVVSTGIENSLKGMFD